MIDQIFKNLGVRDHNADAVLQHPPDVVPVQILVDREREDLVQDAFDYWLRDLLFLGEVPL